MDEKIKRIQKKVKADTIFILVMILLMIGLAGNSMSWMINFVNKDASSFIVQMDKDDFSGTLRYCLHIDGKSYGEVNYNDYCKLDSDGNMNPKAQTIIESAVSMIQYLMMAIVFIMIYMILSRIRKSESPFQMKSVNSLRAAAIWCFILALVPGAVEVITSFMVYSYTIINVSKINFFVILIGIVLGVISEIFKYGCELQDDLDQIA